MRIIKTIVFIITLLLIPCQTQARRLVNVNFDVVESASDCDAYRPDNNSPYLIFVTNEAGNGSLVAYHYPRYPSFLPLASWSHQDWRPTRVKMVGSTAYVGLRNHQGDDGQLGKFSVRVTGQDHFGCNQYAITEHWRLDLNDLANDIDVVGNIAYVATGPGGFAVVDLSDPDNPELVEDDFEAFHDNGGDARDVEIAGDILVVADGAAGIAFFDISDLTSPEYITHFDTPGFAQDIDIQGYRVLVADHNCGLQAVYFDDPEDPWSDQYDTPGHALGVTGHGRFIYVADGGNGVLVINAENDNIEEWNQVHRWHHEGIWGIDLSNNMRKLSLNNNMLFCAEGPSEEYDWGQLIVFNANDFVPPKITIADNSLNFGSIQRDGSSERTLTIGNQNGRTWLSVHGFTVFGDAFEMIDNPPVIIPDGESFDFRVRFNPGAIGDYSGEIYIQSDNPNYVAPVELSGTGIGGLDHISTCNTTGTARKAVKKDDHLFVADGQDGLQVISYADPDDPELVNSLEFQDDVTDLFIYGDFLYLACNSAGLAIADITDADNPRLRSVMEAVNSVKSVRVIGDYAYIADDGLGLRIIDVSDRDNPVETGQLEFESNTLGMDAVGDHIYIANGETGLRIIDVSDPAEPEQVSLLDTPGSVESLDIKGNHAYIADGENGLVVADIGNPANPSITSNLETDGYTRHISVHRDYAYAAEGNAGFRIIDISHYNNPFSAASYDSPESVFSLAVYGDDLFICGGEEGIALFRSDEFAKPEIELSTSELDFGSVNPGLAEQRTLIINSTGSIGLTVTGAVCQSDAFEVNIDHPFVIPAGESRELIITFAPHDMMEGTFDMVLHTDYPGNEPVITMNAVGTREYGTLAAFQDAFRITVDGQYAYMSEFNDGILNIIDVSNPRNPQLVSNLEMPGANAHGAAVRGDWLYLACWGSGLRVINIEDPAHPQIAGEWDSPGHGVSVTVLGDYAYLADRTGGLRILDVSDPDNIREVGSYTELQHGRDVFIIGSLAYIAGGESGLLILDISDPADPSLVGTYDSPGYAYDVQVAGNLAYITDTNEGIRLVDVSDPERPEAISVIETETASERLMVSGDYLYSAETENGLHIYDISDPQNPSQVDQYDTPGNVAAVFVSGEYAYITDHMQAFRSIYVGDCPRSELGLEYLPGFTVIEQDEEADMSFTITNSGNSDLTVSGVMVYGDGFSCDFDYENPLVIASGEERQVAVGFSSDEVGYHRGETAIISNHPGNDQFIYMTAYVRGEEGATLMADMNLGGNVHASDVAGNYAYVGTSDGLNIIDIRDPLHPEVIVQDWGDRQYRLLDIQGDILAAVSYTGLWRLETIDISDPENPVRLDYLVTGEVPTDICYFQNAIYITFLRDMWITNLRGFWVSNPEDIQDMSLNAIGLGDNLVTLDLVGNYIYTCDRDEGLYVVSIHDRWNPVIVGHLEMEQRMGNFATADYQGLVVHGNYAFWSIKCGWYSNVEVLDISDPANPEYVTTFDVPAGSDIEVRGYYAYVSSRDEFRIIDIIDPTQPEVIESHDIETPQYGYPHLNVSRSLLFVSDYNHGLQIWNTAGFGSPWMSVSDPVIDFGELDIETPQSVRNLSIENTGNSSLTINTVRVINDDFSTDFDQPVTIEPGNSHDLNVTFFPRVNGEQEGAIYFFSDHPEDLSPVELTGSKTGLPEEIGSCNIGNVTNLMVRDNMAFGTIYSPYYLRLVDITDPEHPDHVSEVEMRGFVHGVDLSGDYAYVAHHRGWYGGFSVVNISDPENPEIAHDIDVDYHVNAVLLAKGYAFIGGYNGMSVIDITNPEEAEVVWNIDNEFIDAMAYQEPYLYTTEGAGHYINLSVYNITDPENPRLVFNSNLFEGGPGNDIHIIDHYVVIAGSVRIRVYDITEGWNPRLVRSIETPGDAKGIDIVGNYAYIADGMGLSVYDFSDPENPEFEMTIELGGTSQKIQVNGDETYIANANFGLLVVDVSLFPKPAISLANDLIDLGEVPIYQYAETSVSITNDGDAELIIHGINFHDGHFQDDLQEPVRIEPGNQADIPFVFSAPTTGDFSTAGVIQSNCGGLESFTVTATVIESDLRFVGSYRPGGLTKAVRIIDNLALLGTAQGAGLKVIDISNPAEPGYLGGWYTFWTRDIDVLGNNVYVADDNHGIRVITIANPEDPRGVEIVDPGRVFGVDIRGYNLFVAEETHFLIYNIENPQEMREICSVDLDEGYSGRGVEVAGNMAYITAAQGGLLVYDISDLGDPQLIGNLELEGSAEYIDINGEYACIGAGDGGFYVVNISNPAEPELTGHLNFENSVWGVSVHGDFAYLSNAETGVVIVNIENPEEPVEICRYDTPGMVNNLFISGDHCFVADYQNGLQILDCSDILKPELTLPEGGIDFGEVLYGESTFTLTNNNFPTLTINEVLTVGDMFACDFDGFCRLERDATCDIRVTYTAPSAEEHNGYLMIISDHPGAPFYIPLTGTGAELPIIAVSPDTITFESTPLQGRETLPLLITNYGFNDLVISGMDVDGDYFSVDFEQELVIAPGETCEVMVAFTPENAGDYGGTLTVTSNDLDNRSIEIPLLGFCRSPDLNAAESFNLGDCVIDQVIEKGYNVENNGEGTLLVFGYEVIGESFYTDFAQAFEVAPGESHEILLTFAPHEVRDYEGILTVYTNDPEAVVFEVILEGAGTAVRELGFYHRPGGRSRDVETREDYLFQAGSYDFDIVNISDPAHPQLTGSLHQQEDIRGLTIENDYAYLCTAAGLKIVDISDLENPQEIGVYDSPGSASDVDVQGDYAYLDDQSTMRIIDVSDPTEPACISSVETGWSRGVLAVNDIVFVAGGTHRWWRAYDVSDPENPNLIVHVDVSYQYEQRAVFDICVVGNYAYVTVQTRGIFIYDISDIEHPERIGHCETPGHARAVTVSGDHAFVADQNDGLRIIDVSDRENPEEVCSIGTPSYAVNLTLIDNMVIVADEMNGARIIDVSITDKPQLTLPEDAFDFSEAGQEMTFASSFTVANNGNANLTITDVFTGSEAFSSAMTEPVIIAPGEEGEVPVCFTPTEIREYSCEAIIYSDHPGRPQSITLTGSGVEPTRQIAIEQDPVHICTHPGEANEGIVTVHNQGNSWLTISNVETEGENFAIEFEEDIRVHPQEPEDIHFTFSADDFGEYEGVMTVTSDDPDNETLAVNLLGHGGWLEEVGAFDPEGSVLRIETRGNLAFTTTIDGVLHIVDISEPSTPVEINSIQVADRAADVAVEGDLAYVTGNTDNSIYVIDFSDLENLVEVGSLENLPARTTFLDVFNNMVYVVLQGGDQHMGIIDVSNPQDMRLIGTFSSDYGLSELEVVNDIVYAVGDGLWIVDISDPEHPNAIGSADVGYGTWLSGVSVAGDYAYVSDHNSRGLRVFDISNKEEPVRVGWLSFPYFARGIDVMSNHAYVAIGSRGLRVVDVSNPAQPEPILSQLTDYYAGNVLLNGDHALITGLDAGMRLAVNSDFPIPCLATSEDRYDFGDVNHQDTEYITVEISNIGEGVLTVTDAAAVDDCFAVEFGQPVVLANGESCGVEVSFTPDDLGEFEGELSVWSDNPTPLVKVPLTGTCVGGARITLDPEAVDFGMIPPGQNAQDSFLLSNTGNRNLVYSLAVEYPIDDLGDQVQGGIFPSPSEREYPTPTVFSTSVRTPYRDEGIDPGEGGYYWIDSNEENGPEFEWIDISGLDGVQRHEYNGNGSNWLSQVLNLGFVFPWYGEGYSQIFISSYGWICLNPEYRNYRDLPYMLAELPNEGLPNPTLCVQCPTLNLGDGGEIMFWTDGENMAVITFQEMLWRYQRNITKTFQAVIHSDGWVKYQYGEQGGYYGNFSNIGYENEAGTQGASIVFHEANQVQDGMAVWIGRHAEGWLTLNPVDGTLEPDQYDEVTVEISAQDIRIGEHVAEIIIMSNDPSNRRTLLPVYVNVNSVPPAIEVEPEAFEFALITGENVAREATVTNAGGERLRWNAFVRYIDEEEGFYGADSKPDFNQYDLNTAPCRDDLGEPDGGGYFWIDNSEDNGPEFDWINIRNVQGALRLRDDQWRFGPYPLGFYFPWYDTIFDSLIVDMRGWVGFRPEDMNVNFNWYIPDIPSEDPPNAVLAVNNVSLVIPERDEYYGHGEVWFWTNNRDLAVVTWHEIGIYLPNRDPGHTTLQVVISAEGWVKYQYGPQFRIVPAIVGFESPDGRYGARIHDIRRNNNDVDVTPNGRVIWIGRYDQWNADQWLTLNPGSGVLEPDVSEEIAFLVDAADLETGFYEAEASFLSNDPEIPQLIVPIGLAVEGLEPEIVVEPDALDYGEVPFNTESSLELNISNVGMADLVISDIQSSDECFPVDFEGGFVLEPDEVHGIILPFNPDRQDEFGAVLTVFSNDPENGELEIPLTGIGINLPPEVIQPIENVTIAEDSEQIDIADLESVFADINGDALTFSVEAPDGLDLQVSDQNILTLQPAENFFGNDLEARVIADDGWEEEGIIMVIQQSRWTDYNDPQPVDQAPRGALRSVEGSVDPRVQQSTFLNQPDMLLEPHRDVSSEDVFLVTVTPINDPPVINAPTGEDDWAVEVVETGELTINFSATDVDNDADDLRWVVNQDDGLPEGWEFTDIEDGTAEFSWIPGFDDEGEYRPVFGVIDPGEATDEITLIITVTNLNREPFIHDLNEENWIEAVEGDEVTFDLEGEDPDGDELAFDWDRGDLPEAAQMVDNGDGTASFRWQTERGDAGNYSPSFVVTDGILEGVLELVIAVGESPVEEFVVDLSPRWNMISTPIPPDDVDMEVIWADMVNRDNLELVKDHLGNFYAPGYGYNGIGNWDFHFGYLVKVIEADELPFTGEYLPVDEVIPLRLGWSMVAYYPEAMVPAPQAFANLGDLIIMAKDGSGHFYVAAFGYSDMGELQRGQGYLVKVSEATELTWNVPDQMAMVQSEPAEPAVSTPDYYAAPQPTDQNMSLLLIGDRSLEGCDVAAFSSEGYVVGAGRFDEDGRSGLAVWGDDQTTESTDGLPDGARFYLRMWDASQGNEKPLRIDQNITNSDLLYQKDNFIALGVSIEPEIPDAFCLAGAYPNPFNSVTTLSYGLPVATSVTVDLFDLSGRLTAKLVEKESPAGYYSVSWNGQGATSGIYIVRMQAGEYVQSMKLILIK